MARNPIDDVADGIARRWKTSVALVAAVPGNLEHALGTEAQPNTHPYKTRALPYAIYRVEKLQEPELSTANRAIHHHGVTIDIYGLKAGVTAVLELLWNDPATALPVFVRQELLMDGANGRRAMAVLELGDDLVKGTTKEAEDLWKGSHHLHVMTDRSLA